MPNPHDLTGREGVQVYAKAIALTPNDATVVDPPRALYVGGNGDLAVRFFDAPGVTITFIGVKEGGIYPFAVTRVMAATTATGIVALY